MKDTRDSQAWVPIVAGVVGLLAVGLAFRQCGSSPSSESVSEPKVAAQARLADNDRGGWIAQSQRRTNGAASQRGGAGTTNGRMADGAAPSRLERGSEPGDLSGSSGHDAGDHDFRDTDTVDAGGDNIAAQPRLPAANAASAGGPGSAGGLGSAGALGTAGGPGSTGAGATNAAGNAPGSSAAGAPHAARPGADQTGTAPTDQVVGATDAVKADAADPNGPVLSLPLDKSAEPDKGGDGAPIIATGVTFDGNGANFSSNAQLLLPSDGTVNNAAGTVTFWMSPGWPEGDTDSVLWILHLGPPTWQNHLEIFKDHRFLRLLLATNANMEAGAVQDITSWKTGDRHMVTATWGDSVTVLYVDGVSAGANDYDGELDLGTNPPFLFGSPDPGKKAADVNIKGFQLYQRALGPDEVDGLFAQGPP